MFCLPLYHALMKHDFFSSVCQINWRHNGIWHSCYVCTLQAQHTSVNAWAFCLGLHFVSTVSQVGERLVHNLLFFCFSSRTAATAKLSSTSRRTWMYFFWWEAKYRQLLFWINNKSLPFLQSLEGIINRHNMYKSHCFSNYIMCMCNQTLDLIKSYDMFTVELVPWMI